MRLLAFPLAALLLSAAHCLSPSRIPRRALLLSSAVILPLGIRTYIHGPAPYAVPPLPPRTVVVTGANTGLGKETAARLAGSGARVFLCSRDEARGRKAVEEVERGIPEGSGGSAELLLLDLADLGSIDRAAEDLKKRTKVVDVVINNAGVMAIPGAFAPPPSPPPHC